MNVTEIVEFMMERSVGIHDFKALDFSVHCTPEEVWVREADMSRPYRITKEFFKGIVWSHYDFFLNEVNEIKKEMLDGEE